MVRFFQDLMHRYLVDQLDDALPRLTRLTPLATTKPAHLGQENEMLNMLAKLADRYTENPDPAPELRLASYVARMADWAFGSHPA